MGAGRSIHFLSRNGTLRLGLVRNFENFENQYFAIFIGIYFILGNIFITSG